MLDIKLNSDGDIDVSALGDISLTQSVRQAIRVRLRWIYGEWRLGPDYGLQWFEEIFVKNPNLTRIRLLIRDEILKVDEVTSADVQSVEYDKASRTAKFVYTCSVGEAVFKDEVTLYG